MDVKNDANVTICCCFYHKLKKMGSETEHQNINIEKNKTKLKMILYEIVYKFSRNLRKTNEVGKNQATSIQNHRSLNQSFHEDEFKNVTENISDEFHRIIDHHKLLMPTFSSTHFSCKLICEIE